jgi:hypothetical protein
MQGDDFNGLPSDRLPPASPRSSIRAALAIYPVLVTRHPSRVRESASYGLSSGGQSPQQIANATSSTFNLSLVCMISAVVMLS